MLTKLELHPTRGFYTQRYFFEDDSILVEEGGRLDPQRSSRYFVCTHGVDDLGDGAKYHWGP